MASANLNVMIKAARKAGRSLVKDFREVENLQVSVKGAGDFVSKADPTRRWIVDPLDGTTNFLHGLPHWAISIALEHKKEIVASVIFDAAKDELFVAEKGGGAFMNDQRLRVSGRRRLDESLFATGIPFAGRGPLPAALQDLARLMPLTAGVRRMGSAALDLAYVAAGRYDCWCARRAALSKASATAMTRWNRAA